MSSSLCRSIAFAVSYFVLVSASLLVAQESPTSGQADANAQLPDRVRELEAKVKELEEKLNSLAPGLTTAKTPLPAPDTAAAATSAPAPIAEEQPQVNEVAERMKLLYFGDVGYERGRYFSPTNTFYLGEFNLFANARLTDKVSVLGDILFTSDSDNTISVDVERLLLKYRENRYFTASIGRIHTAIGYYNTAFDRGEYFQTPIGRPVMYEFDDQGGFLPMQDLGVVLNGELPTGKLHMKYVFEVTNGRNYGVNVEPAQNNVDFNNSKAVNFGLSVKPDALHGLLLGFSFRHDNLSDVNNLGVSEIIPTVYAIYTEHNYEFLNEAMDVRHTLPSGLVFHTPGFYTQVSRGFGKYRPYFVYSWVNAPLDDPIYGNPTEVPVVGRENGPSIGLRYDFTPYSAFKVQYQRQAANIFKATNGLGMEVSFTF